MHTLSGMFNVVPWAGGTRTPDRGTGPHQHHRHIMTGTPAGVTSPRTCIYGNHAACRVSMEPSRHEVVVADCDEALKLDMRYFNLKVLNRSATALQVLECYEDSLQDA
ncbi:hypothetical protein H4582DRAFT_2056143 [Lactarius indigo]|nr:hypothetical protein H4582DRAFT_2056143 [Lactarius indigo]